MTVSNTPTPPGTWLLTPATCATTKSAAKCAKVIGAFAGIRT
jgi:hypothetical protein